MYEQSYLDKKNKIRQQLVQATDCDSALLRSASYNMASASLSNFLPGIPPQQHLLLYKRILYHQQLSVLDQVHPEPLDDMIVEPRAGAIIAQLRYQPSIIVTFHTGSYRLLNLYLLRHRVPFTLVLAKEVLEQQGDHFREVYSRSSGGATLDCIDAERPVAALQMLRALKKGNALVVYIDGNTGAPAPPDHLLPVPFLNGRLLSRTGISVISHLAGAPIHCLATYYGEAERLTLAYLCGISPAAEESKEDFIERSMRAIYNQLAQMVSRYPGEWEGWLYLHKSVHLLRKDTALPVAEYSPAGLSGNFYRLNSKDFAIFISDEQYFLLHKRSYTFYLIDRCLFDCLSRDRFAAMALPGAEAMAVELLRSGVVTPVCLPV